MCSRHSLGMWWHWLLPLIYVTTPAQSYIDPEEATRRVEALQLKLNSLPQMMDLYRADLEHKLANNTFSVQHFRDIDDLFAGLELEGLPLTRDLDDEVKALLHKWRQDIRDPAFHEEIKDKIYFLLNDIDEDLKTSVTEAIKRLVDRLVASFANKKDVEADRRLPHEIYKYIMSDEFKEAATLTLNIGTKSRLRYIVRRVYSHSLSRFETLMTYAKTITNVNRSFLVYRNIYEEMIINNHKHDIDKLVTILEQLAVEVENQSWFKTEADADFQRDVKNLKERIRQTIVDESAKLLKNSILSNENPTKKDVALCKLVHQYDRSLYKDTWVKVVKEVFDKVPTNKLLDFASKQSFIEQEINGLLAVLDKMRGTNNDGLLKVGYIVKKMMAYKNFVNVKDNFKDIVKGFKAELGESILNAVFADKFCIKNVDKEGYLNGSTLGGASEWRAIWENNAVKLKRVGTDKVLCATSDRKLMYNRTRPVLEDMEDGCGEDWWLRRQSNGACLIRNIKFDEYLYARGTGEVGTQLDGEIPQGSTWRLGPCDTETSLKIVQEELQNYNANFENIMKQPGQKDVGRLMTNLENIERLSDNVYGTYYSHDQELKSKVDHLRQRIHDAVVVEGANYFKTSLEKNKLPTAETKELAKRINVYSKPFYMEVVRKMVQDTFGKVSIIRLLDFVIDQSYIEQEVNGMVVVFQKMNKELDMSGLLKLGQIVKKTLNFDNYPNIRDEFKEKVQGMKVALGASIENAIFVGDVCVKNSDIGQYLNGSTLTDPKGNTSTTEWKMIWNEDGIKIMRNENIALCAKRDKKQVKNGRRPVVEGEENCAESWWVDRLPGGACAIRNVEFNEYLFVDESGRVKTTKAFSGNKPERSTWRIEQCTGWEDLQKVREFFSTNSPIYKEIMGRSGAKDMTKLLQILYSYRQIEELNSKITDKQLQMDVRNLNRDATKTVVEESSNVIKNSLEFYDLPTEQTKEALKQVYLYSSNQYYGILRTVIKEVFANVPTKKLLDFVLDQKFIEQEINGLVMVLIEMKGANDMTALLKLGYQIQKILEFQKYENVNKENKNIVEKMRAELGESIHNAVFAQQVCVKNVDRVAYLTGPNLGNKTEWDVDLEKNVLRITKVGSEEELCATDLLANNTTEESKGMRPVMEGEDCKEEWWVEPLPEGECLIRNIKFNEYLFAAETGEVGTWLNGTRPPGSTWHLEFCDNLLLKVKADISNLTHDYEYIKKEQKDVVMKLEPLIGIRDNFQRILTYLKFNDLVKTDPDFAESVEGLMRNVDETMLEESVKQITHSLETEEQTNQTREVCKIIHQHSRPLYQDVIQRVTREKFDKIPMRILDFITNPSFIEQEVNALKVFVDHMEAVDNKKVMLKVGYNLKKIANYGRYKFVTNEFTTRMAEMRNSLGASIENAVYAEEVCVKNVDHDKYLAGTKLGDKEVWKVQWDSQNWVLLLRPDVGKGLCAIQNKTQGGCGEGCGQRKGVREVLEGGEDCEEKWWVEPLPEGECLIRNIKFNEYLFAGETGEVGTWLNGTRPPGTTWRLELCPEAVLLG